MLRHYFVIAIRSLGRQKGYTVINLFGLTIGICCTILIGGYVLDELNYDTYHPDIDNTYRVALHRTFRGSAREYSTVPIPMAEALKNDFPEITASTRIWNNLSEISVEYEDQEYFESEILAADSNFFDFFGIKLLQGNPQNALNQPNSVVITSSTAQKYFGTKDALGKTIRLHLGQETNFKVSGVCEDVPPRTHFDFDLLISFITLPAHESSMWGAYQTHTYVRLTPDTSPALLQEKIPPMVEQYMAPQVQSMVGITYEQYVNAGNIHTYYFQPIQDIHLHSNLQGELQPNSDIRYIYLFSIIAAFILIIACINFINLSTASASRRAREVGMRKVLGSHRSQLVTQFLSESGFISAIAASFGLGLALILLPYFNDLAGKTLAASDLSFPVLALGFILLIATVSLLAGSYPAFFLSGFQPVNILKGDYLQGQKGGFLRNTLVVFQFSISVVLIIATIVIYQQMQHMMNQKLGFDKERLVIIERANLLNDQRQLFEDQLLAHPDILSLTRTFAVPGRQFGGGTFQAIGSEASERYLNAAVTADTGFVHTLGLELIAGRNFSEDIASDSATVLVNEATARLVGWENPVGEYILPTLGQRMQIIGVVKDFNFQSLHEEIGPLVIFPNLQDNFNPSLLTVRLGSGDVRNSMQYIEEKWNTITNHRHFEFTFMDEEFDQLYREEARFGQIFSLFALLTILIASIGVLGLSTYLVSRRIKEIGIRKVLGASETNILVLLGKNFLGLVVLANLLAWPIAWFGINQWLETYAYHIDIGLWVFGITAVLSVLIVMLAVSIQSWKAATASPVEAIRQE